MVLVFVGILAGCGGQAGVTQQRPATDDVVQAFRDAGLEIADSYDVEDDPQWGTGMVPKTMDSGTRFELSGYEQMGEQAIGDVYHFATPDDQEVLSNYFDTVSKSSGLFYVHVYETDGYMLKIDGRVPKATADSYGEVLKNTT